MNEKIIKKNKIIENLCEKFFNIIENNYYGDLQRTPFKISTYNGYSTLEGERNGAVFYTSSENTFYSLEVATMTMTSHLFANVLKRLQGNRDIEEFICPVIKYITDSVDLGMPDPSFIFYFEPSNYQGKTSYDNQLICDELNKYSDEDFEKNSKNIQLLVQMSQIFHGIKLLLDKNSIFRKKIKEDIEKFENDKTASIFLGQLYFIQEDIIKGLGGFIELFRTLESENNSEDDIPF